MIHRTCRGTGLQSPKFLEHAPSEINRNKPTLTNQKCGASTLDPALSTHGRNTSPHKSQGVRILKDTGRAKITSAPRSGVAAETPHSRQRQANKKISQHGKDIGTLQLLPRMQNSASKLAGCHCDALQKACRSNRNVIRGKPTSSAT